MNYLYEFEKYLNQFIDWLSTGNNLTKTIVALIGLLIAAKVLL